MMHVKSMHHIQLFILVHIKKYALIYTKLIAIVFRGIVMLSLFNSDVPSNYMT